MNKFTFEQHKFRFERHKKACKTCKYNICSITRGDCKKCEINPLDSVWSCPCLGWDDGKKYSRCKYYKSNKEEKDE